MGSLSQPRLNMFTVGRMRVMICFGQGGLRSPSASTFLYHLSELVVSSHCLNIKTDQESLQKHEKS